MLLCEILIFNRLQENKTEKNLDNRWVCMKQG